MSIGRQAGSDSHRLHSLSLSTVLYVSIGRHEDQIPTAYIVYHYQQYYMCS